MRQKRVLHDDSETFRKIESFLEQEGHSFDIYSLVKLTVHTTVHVYWSNDLFEDTAIPVDASLEQLEDEQQLIH